MIYKITIFLYIKYKIFIYIYLIIYKLQRFFFSDASHSAFF